MGVLSGPWTWRRFVSFVHLAIAFNVRQLRRVFRGEADNGGERRFLENYSGEGMKPLSEGDERLVRALGACIYCGLCEAVCPTPVDRWTSFSRALASAAEARASVPAECPEGCKACEAACPTGVPLREIPAFLARRGG